MHQSRERVVDYQFRLRCRSCDGHRFAELGGQKKERAEAGEDVTEYCGLCETRREFEVVAP